MPVDVQARSGRLVPVAMVMTIKAHKWLVSFGFPGKMFDCQETRLPCLFTPPVTAETITLLEIYSPVGGRVNTYLIEELYSHPWVEGFKHLPTSGVEEPVG